LGLGEDTLIPGAMAGCQASEGAEKVGDGSASAAKDGGDHQGSEALESRRGKCRGEGEEERLSFVG
jgi:hypothetical protein